MKQGAVILMVRDERNVIICYFSLNLVSRHTCIQSDLAQKSIIIKRFLIEKFLKPKLK